MSQLNSLPWTSNPEGTQSVQPGEIVADCKQRPCRLAGGQHTLHLLQSLEPQIISLQNARSFILFQKSKMRWLFKFTNYNTLISEKQDKVKGQVPRFAEAAPPVGSFLGCQASQLPLPSAPSSLPHYQKNLWDTEILMRGFPRPTVAVLSPPEKDLLQLAARTAAGCICLQAAVQ